MKKIFSITVAALVLSFAAIGASSCAAAAGEEVTAEEWVAATNSANALNVTMEGTYSERTAVTSAGSARSVAQKTEIIAQTALENVVAENDGTYAVGNSYMYIKETESMSVDEEEYSETAYQTQYENSSVGTYLSVIKLIDGSGSEGWSSDAVSSSVKASEFDTYSTIAYFMDYIYGMYSYFTYDGGEYSYSGGYSGTSITVTFSGGHLATLKWTTTTSYSYGTYLYMNATMYDIEFYDYGTTYVTVPQEYTYDHSPTPDSPLDVY